MFDIILHTMPVFHFRSYNPNSGSFYENEFDDYPEEVFTKAEKNIIVKLKP